MVATPKIHSPTIVPDSFSRVAPSLSEAAAGSTIRFGMHGEGVVEVQQALVQQGYELEVDGLFGLDTRAAVEDFQEERNLRVDGYVGPQTARALRVAPVPSPESGGAVRTGAPRAPTDADRVRGPGAGEVRAGDLARVDDFRRAEHSRANVFDADRYPPGSAEAKALFRAAAPLVRVPERWADSPGLHQILAHESGGIVGRPNYTYGARARDPSRWPEIHDELRRGVKSARSSATGLGQLLLANVDAYYPSGREGIGDPLQEAAGMLAYIADRYGSPEVAWRRYNTLHEGY